MSDNNYKITDTLQKYYDKVFEDGKLVSVHIGMWGMCANLVEEDIKLTTKLPETHKLGKKMLIKPEVYNRFKTMDQKIRKALEKGSFDFPLARAHFVPKTKYLEVHSRLNELRGEYMQMVDEFVEKYEDYKKEAMAFYEENKETILVENLEAYYPPASKIRSKFYCDIVSFEVKMPKEFSEINLQDEITREQMNVVERENAARRYKEEFSKQVDLHTEKLKSFMDEATSELRTRVAEHFTVALTKVNKNEVITDNSIRRMYEQINDFRAANFANDTAVEAQLNELEKLLNGTKDFSKDRNAMGLLKQHLASVVQEARNTSDITSVSGEYFRNLDI
jgi:DNA-binding ferritin-like protein